ERLESQLAIFTHCACIQIQRFTISMPFKKLTSKVGKRTTHTHWFRFSSFVFLKSNHQVFKFEEFQLVNEPTFIPRSEDAGEDDGKYFFPQRLGISLKSEQGGC